MFEAQALEMPFMADLPKREKSRVGKLWDHFNEVRRQVAQVGMIVPQHLAADLLGLSRQRIFTLAEQGRLETVEIGGIRYLTERSVLAFAQSERKNGRPPKSVSTGELVQISLQHGREARQALSKGAK